MRFDMSPFEEIQARLNAMAMPVLPSQSGDRAAAQRNWKTILEGGTVGNILPVGANDTAQVVTVAGPNEDAHVMAVTLIPPLVPFGTSTTASVSFTNQGFEGAIALMQWGVGGGVCSAEVDVGRGAAFSLVASALRIFIKREQEGTFPLLNTFSYGAAISKGPIANPTRMTRTFNSKSQSPAGLAPSAQFLVTIPPYAKYVYPISLVDSAIGGFVGPRPMFIEMLTFNGVSCGGFLTGLNQLPPRIELPNQASTIFFTNMSATETVNMQIVFELAL